MKHATFRLHGALNFFLPRQHKDQHIAVPFNWKASVKDMLESVGPPHPEVALLIVNGHSQGWEYIVQHGDVIDAYPDFDAVELPHKVRLIPPYPGKPRFVLDTHLGKLAGYLRMMGFDTLYRNDYPDDELARISHEEERIVLTRDVGVLKRGRVVFGYYVRNTAPRLRLHEINQRYHLTDHMQPFRYCMKCNGLLHPITKAAILDQIPPDTASYYDEFHQCAACQQIYWKGSHYQKMAQLIDELARRAP